MYSAVMASRRSSSRVSSIIEGNALDPKDWAKLQGTLNKYKCDLLLTDPPYCRLVRRRRGGDEREPSTSARRRKLASDETTLRFESMLHYATFTASWVALALEHGLRPGADCIIWTNPLGREVIIKAMLAHGYLPRAEYLWAKSPLTPTPTLGKATTPTAQRGHSQGAAVAAAAAATTTTAAAAAGSVHAAVSGETYPNPNNPDPNSMHAAVSGETLLRLHESALIFRHASRLRLAAPAGHPGSTAGTLTLGTHQVPLPGPGVAVAATAAADANDETDWSAPRCAITPTPQHDHPCYKPLPVVAPLIYYYSRPGERVLDCFAGSGAIVRACERLGRVGVGMEVLPTWVERSNQDRPC